MELWAYRYKSLICYFHGGLLLFFCCISQAQSSGVWGQDDPDLSYLDLSLDQLSDIQIISAAKKPQKISQTAASIYVLEQEDIRRSGVTSIPDALRLVPGVQVAKLDANKWAIAIRGFNDILSNKLLVLMDGRSVYSPFFGGAYWDTIDTVLEDIERIEVIRGPGGTLWGANAVNGVINIITKHASRSQGTLVSVLAGNEERGKISARYGDKVGEDTYYRAYVKGFEKDATKDGIDDWRMGRAGFRVDSESWQKNKLTLQGDVYSGNEGERAVSSINVAPFGTFDSDINVFGANVMFRWQRDLGDDSDLSLQGYYDRTEREHFYVTDYRDTFDLDFQHRFKTFLRQEIIWGLGFRYISDETEPGTVMSLDPKDRVDRIYSAFVQDEFSLIPEELTFTVGSKFEHNSYTGFEYQPSARLLWKLFDAHSLWTSVSRAVRIPSRIEDNIILARNPIITIVGSEAMDSEVLIAYELGYRYLDARFNFDISFFYNDYQRLRSLEMVPGSSGQFAAANELDGEVYGFELSSTWQINDSWRLVAGYSYTQMQLHPTPESGDTTEEADEGDTPHHQSTLRSMWQVDEDWQFDVVLRYVDEIKAINQPKIRKEGINEYFTMDMRLAWEAHESVDLSLVGQNLFGNHREFRGSTVDTLPTDVEPSVYLQADFRF